MTTSRTASVRRVLGALLLGAAGVAGAVTADPFVPGDILVRLSSTSALPPLLAKYSLTLAGQFGARPVYRLKVIGNVPIEPVIAQLALEPGVLVAEPNSLHQSPEARKNVVWSIGTAEQYANQWAPAALKLANAHAISTGAGVRVAVIDTGVDFAHPALAGKLLPGRDYVDGDDDPSEVGGPADRGWGHGTHVAGLVALAAPGARIVPLRVLDPNGQGSVWTLAQAMLHAVDPDGNPASLDGAHVINASVGTLDRTRLVESVMLIATCNMPRRAAGFYDYTDPGYNGDKERCRKRGGAVVVAAAGNGSSRDEKQYPAAEGEYGLLSVAASAENGRIATFSNWGNWIQVAAPGDKVTSTVPGGQYGTWSGTSMAAPLAAGVAALVRARFPTMTPKDVARRLEDTTAKLCAFDDFGQVDAHAALLGYEPLPVTCR